METSCKVTLGSLCSKWRSLCLNGSIDDYNEEKCIMDAWGKNNLLFYVHHCTYLGQFVNAASINLTKVKIYSNSVEKNNLLSYILIQLSPNEKVIFFNYRNQNRIFAVDSKAIEIYLINIS